MKREPAVAGQFYPSSPSELSEMVKEYTGAAPGRMRVTGVVSPHAGLMYSGRVAAAVFSGIEFPDTFILLGPNHTGIGSRVSIMSSGEWRMPTGRLKIDSDIAGRLKAHCSLFEENAAAHQMEHSLEVQLPFILYNSSDVKIVPVTMMSCSLEQCRLTGEAIADVIMSAGYPVTIIASSDMSHYISDAAARKRDKMAIERITALDPEGLYNTVRDEGISMCGVVPVTSMLFAALKLGAQEASLVKYMTSGEVSGDFDYVVGYAGITVK
ncbi:MAG: AmmeMemoRadiSam system protein B [Nitrospirota bacterium]|nr:AmmeMemoRadiSam system protein B [Nitrospirota bacterium]